ncbi:mannose-6-phosphate isomerase isoform X1 [Nilaparvata lugens]|uniref:mannose-6-phosphate isomerase isoform X1 n=1 Tax=Nilaparvata lugens TaxID=108931 RepID=UPI00193C975A|nr:mannose-6-phosphate isomerase isoform X1 [Nilaparvata lugens]
MELIGSIQNYHWGQKGSASIVARLAAGIASDVVDENRAYAELWMGTHVSGPATVRATGQLLADWLLQNQHKLGEKVLTTFGAQAQLPFLFKVLSVKQPLSIQAHPDKALAGKLHSQRPDIYKDANHKPELAIALSEFEALCGFRPLAEIKQFMEDVPELRSIIGDEILSELQTLNSDHPRHVLEKCLRVLLTTADDAIEKKLSKLISRMKSMDEASRKSVYADLVERCHQYYPGDVGCFGPYFFNHVTLKPGEALYLPASEPHAYISGDCVECMACSDNVIRAGLTPKLKDVDTLCSMLSYACEAAHSKLFRGQLQNEFCTLFCPPVPDFAVARFQIPAGKTCTMAARDSSSISIVISGEGTIDSNCQIGRGSILFIGAHETKTVTVISDLVLFQAFANV